MSIYRYIRIYHRVMIRKGLEGLLIFSFGEVLAGVKTNCINQVKRIWIAKQNRDRIWRFISPVCSGQRIIIADTPHERFATFFTKCIQTKQKRFQKGRSGFVCDNCRVCVFRERSNRTFLTLLSLWIHNIVILLSIFYTS